MTGTEHSRRARRRIAVMVTAVALVAAGVVAVLAAVGSLGRSDRPSEGPNSAAAIGGSTSAQEGEEPLGADRLLGAAEVARSLPGRTWRVVGTDDNSRGSGLRWVCQQARYADPDGIAALVRTTTAQGLPTWRVVQAVERSGSPAAARRAYDTTVGWFAACRAARLQLTGTYRVDGVGDRATLMTLHRAGDPPAELVVGVVEVGDLTSSVVLRQEGPDPGTARGAGATVAPHRAARLLAQATRRLCPDDAPRCVRRPRARSVAPPPSGEAPGTLGVVDLPPVGAIAAPWFGVDPVAARRANPARTACDRAGFAGPEVTRAFSRTYLVPDAALPTRFGLTETVAIFRTLRAATGFVDGVRRAVSRCGDRELATTVRPGPDVAGGPAERVSWTLDTEVAADRTVRLRVGFVRSGRRVAQLTFAPSDADDMTAAQFDALLVRGGERLAEL